MKRLLSILALATLAFSGASAAADAPKPFNELGRAKRRDLI